MQTDKIREGKTRKKNHNQHSLPRKQKGFLFRSGRTAQPPSASVPPHQMNTDLTQVWGRQNMDGNRTEKHNSKSGRNPGCCGMRGTRAVRALAGLCACQAQNHRITKWPRLKGISRIIKLQSPYCRQGRQFNLQQLNSSVISSLGWQKITIWQVHRRSLENKMTLWVSVLTDKT